MRDYKKITAAVFLILLIGSGFYSNALGSGNDNNENVFADTLLVGCEIDYPPFCFINEGGRADGFSIELFRAAAEEMGFFVEFRTGLWHRLKDELARGELDALPLVGRTQKREDIYDFTIPYITMRGAIIVRDDEAAIQSIDDLKEKKVAVMKGDNVEEFLHRNNTGADIIPRSTFNQALTELSEGQYDAVLIQRLLALQLIKQNRLNNLRIIGVPQQLYEQKFSFAVAEGNSHLLSLLNEGLAITNTKGTYRRLQVKWFAPLESVNRKSKRIIVGGDFNFPPYEFLDENGNPSGFNVDLMHAIAEELNIIINIKLGPWPKIQDDLKEGRIDAVQGLLYSHGRDSVFDMTPAHTSISYVIATRKETPIPRNIMELQGKSVLVQTKDLMHEQAIQAGLEEELVPVSSQEEAIRLLSEGDYDYALVSRVLFHYYMEMNKWDNIKAGKDPVYSAEYCVGVAEGNNEMLSKFSEGLTAVKAAGKYHEIYSRWLGIYEKPEFTIRDFLRYTAFIMIPALLFLIAFFVWSRTLQKRVNIRTRELQDEIRVRKKAEKALFASQKKYKNLFTSIQDAILVADSDRNVIECNPAFCEMFGYSFEEIRNSTIGMFYKNEDEYSKMGNALKEYAGEAKDFLFTVHYKKKDGSVFPGETNVFYLEDKEGHVVGYIGLIRDITQRIKAREDLKKSKEKAENYLNIAAEIIISLDTEGRITLLNDSGYKLLGYRSGELTGKNWFSTCVPEEDTLKVKTNFKKLILGGVSTVSRIENSVITKSGERKTILWHNTVLKDDENIVTGTLSSGEDITERKIIEQKLFSLNKELKIRNEEIAAQNEEYETLNEELNEKNQELHAINAELEEAKEKAEESDRLKSAFLANMSHEIRTPMNGILGFASLLNKPDLTGEKKEVYIELIQRSGKRMLIIINDLLDIAKIEAGHIEINIEDVFVNELIDDLYLLFEAEVREKGLVIKAEKSLPASEAVIKTDGVKLNQIISNLIRNAIKFTNSGKIEFGYTTDRDQNFRFFVSDTGIGISEDFQEKIFERFRQAELNAIGEYEGAGLGLSISRAYVEMLGGQMHLESAPGKGSTFYFSIPSGNPALNRNS